MKYAQKKSPDKRAGFSLVELMVVIIILGLLATLVIPNVMSKARWAKRETAKLEIGQIEMAVEEYAIMNSGMRPGELDDLIKPDIHGESFLRAGETLRDPWDTKYAYEEHATGNPRPWIASYAEDKVEGGVGWNEDIINLTMHARD